MAPQTTAIMKLIVDELFSSKNTTMCGPNFEKIQHHFRVLYGTSEENPNLPCIIPDVGYHPEVYVCFDFTHQFTAEGSNAAGGSSQKPVPQEILDKAIAVLANFFDYYFEYVDTKGKQKIQSQLRESVNLYLKSTEIPDSDEEGMDKLYFVNAMINYFLMGVTTDQAINQIGTCTINLSDNKNYRFGEKLQIFYDKTFSALSQLFVPMVPVMVWARGRLYKDWYFPIFDGYITTTTMANNSGFTDITISCRDTLELARISSTMVNPAIVQIKELVGQTNINIFSIPMYGIDHMNIFNTMFHGGKLVFDPDIDKQRLIPGTDAFDKHTNAMKFEPIGNFTASTYLESELGDDVDDVDVLKPNSVYENYAIHKDMFNLYQMLNRLSYKLRPRCTVTWGARMTPYRVFGVQNPDVFTSEFSSRLEILQNIVQIVYYVLYVDGYGNINYHPMRLTNDYLVYDIIDTACPNNGRHKNVFPGSQVISKEETFSESAQLNVEELVTFFRLVGQPPVAMQAKAEQLDLIGTGIDKDKWLKFGYRRKEERNAFFGINVPVPGTTVKILDVMAQVLLQYKNAELYTRQMSIAGRPELRLAAPIFIADTKEVFFCTSISHSIRINGESTTSVNMNFGRSEQLTSPDLFSFLLVTQKLYEVNANIPELAFFATKEEKEQYYTNNFGLNSLHFLEWVEDYDEQLKTYNLYEIRKAKDQVNQKVSKFLKDKSALLSSIFGK